MGYLCTLRCKPRFSLSGSRIVRAFHLSFIITHCEQSITMARQPSSDMVTLFCWVIGESSSFRVDIRRNGFVDDLKAALINKKSRYWGTMETTELKVFLANIPDTDERRRAYRSQRHTYKALAGSKKLASLFENDPPEDTIHVAILAPG